MRCFPKCQVNFLVFLQKIWLGYLRGDYYENLAESGAVLSGGQRIYGAGSALAGLEPREYVPGGRTVHSGSSQIRRCAVENGVTMLTALDTVRVLLDVLEEIILGISTIDAS